jgi:hypothetical protein
MLRTSIVTIRGTATKSTSTGFVSIPIQGPATIKQLKLSTTGTSLASQAMAIGLSEDPHTPANANDVGNKIFDLPTGQTQVGGGDKTLSFDVNIPIEEEKKWLKAYVTNSETSDVIIEVYAVVEYDRG